MDIADKFWKKWVNAIDRAKIIGKITQIIEQDIKEINTTKLSEKEKQSLKARMINTYFEDLYSAYGK